MTTEKIKEKIKHYQAMLESKENSIVMDDKGFACVYYHNMAQEFYSYLQFFITNYPDSAIASIINRTRATKPFLTYEEDKLINDFHLKDIQNSIYPSFTISNYKRVIEDKPSITDLETGITFYPEERKYSLMMDDDLMTFSQIKAKYPETFEKWNIKTESDIYNYENYKQVFLINKPTVEN